jgi:hypothetical protein
MKNGPIIAPATPEGIAAALPPADPRLVRDVLALCGGDLAVTLSVLATAVGTVAAERVSPQARVVVLAGVARVIATTAALRGAVPAGQA